MQKPALLSAILLLSGGAVASRIAGSNKLQARQDAPVQDDGITITMELQTPDGSAPAPPDAGMQPQKRSMGSSPELTDRFKAFGQAGSLDKRQMVRLINSCPRDGANIPFTHDDFEGSSCNRGPNDRDYTIRCGDGISTIPGQGSCRNNEFCVDGVSSDNHPTAAYCIDLGNMVNGVMQLKNANSRGSQTQAINLFASGISGLNYMIEAVVSGPDGPSQGFTASYLSIQAADKTGNLISGTLDECSRCSSIGLEPLPNGFDHAVVKVGLPNPGDTVNLYAGLVSAGRGF